MAKIQTKEIADGAVTEDKFTPNDNTGHDHDGTGNTGQTVVTGKIIVDTAAVGTIAEYNPTGIKDAEIIIVQAAAPVTLLSMTQNTQPGRITLAASTVPITIKNLDPLGTGYKFNLSITNDLVLQPGDSAEFVKAPFASIWNLNSLYNGNQSGDAVWSRSSDPAASKPYWHRLLVNAGRILGRTSTSGLKDLTPSEVRILLNVAEIGYGEMYVSSSAQTTVTQQPTYAKIAGTTTLGDSSGFDMPANNRLRYTGTVTRKFLVTANLTTESTAPDTFRFRIVKNGTTEIAKSEQRRFMSSSNDTGSIGLAAVVELAQNDYVEIFVAREGGSANMTALLMHVSATPLE